MAVSVLEIAQARGITSPVDTEFERVGIPAVCKCFECGKVISPAQAYPSQGGRLKCLDHIGASGFRSAAQFENYALSYSLHKKDKS